MLSFKKMALKLKAAAAHFLKRQHFRMFVYLLGGDGFHRTDIYAGAAVNALVGIDYVLVGTL